MLWQAIKFTQARRKNGFTYRIFFFSRKSDLTIESAGKTAPRRSPNSAATVIPRFRAPAFLRSFVSLPWKKRDEKRGGPFLRTYAQKDRRAGLPARTTHTGVIKKALSVCAYVHKKRTSCET